jgi:hypothetical protein
MITNFSKAEGSLLLGNVGNQPILRQHRVGFQKNALLKTECLKIYTRFHLQNYSLHDLGEFASLDMTEIC